MKKICVGRTEIWPYYIKYSETNISYDENEHKKITDREYKFIEKTEKMIKIAQKILRKSF